MARNREELTQKAVQQGIEVTPGQLESVGLLDAPEGAEAAGPEAPPELKAGEGKYWRIVQVCHAIPADHDQGRPDHVIRAADRANAIARFNHEMGITGFDGQHVRQEVTQATEADYIKAQAKRLRVDLREHRAQPKSKKPSSLTWQPPGGITGKYLVDSKGELTEAPKE